MTWRLFFWSEDHFPLWHPKDAIQGIHTNRKRIRYDGSPEGCRRPGRDHWLGMRCFRRTSGSTDRTRIRYDGSPEGYRRPGRDHWLGMGWQLRTTWSTYRTRRQYDGSPEGYRRPGRYHWLRGKFSVGPFDPYLKWFLYQNWRQTHTYWPIRCGLFGFFSSFRWPFGLLLQSEPHSLADTRLVHSLLPSLVVRLELQRWHMKTDPSFPLSDGDFDPSDRNCSLPLLPVMSSSTHLCVDPN